MTNFVTSTTETVEEGNVVVPKYSELKRYLRMPKNPMTDICGNDKTILNW